MTSIIPDDKASILLVHGKLKPSALIYIEGPVFGDLKHPTHIGPDELIDMDSVFSALGLEYCKTTEIMGAFKEQKYVEVIRFFIARDMHTACKLKILFDNISINHKEIGLLLGYPETSVNAFLTSNMLELADSPESTDEVNKFDMRLLNHRLSKDNWNDEVKYLTQSGKYIKSMSPLIYADATREEKL